MANKLFEMMNNVPQMPGAIGNIQNAMNQFQNIRGQVQQFRSMLNGNGQQAQSQVVQMLNSGRLTKEQLQQAVQMAQAYRNK